MRVSIHDLRALKADGKRFVMLTAYDFPTAQILDRAGVPVLLVGDSVGRNVLGYPNELPVTMDEMLHHVKAVARGAEHAMVVGDMPFMSFQASVEDGVRNAGRMIKEGGAHAVKVEGAQFDLIGRLVDVGIPVMAHVGLTPQSVYGLGGMKVQGRGEAGTKVLEQAMQLEKAGAFAIVLEAMPAELGTEITRSLQIPTIGIGAGPGCDAQVLIIHDLLGITEKPPKLAKAYANVRETMTEAVEAFVQDVECRDVPRPRPHVLLATAAARAWTSAVPRRPPAIHSADGAFARYAHHLARRRRPDRRRGRGRHHRRARALVARRPGGERRGAGGALPGDRRRLLHPLPQHRRHAPAVRVRGPARRGGADPPVRPAHVPVGPLLPVGGTELPRARVVRGMARRRRRLRARTAVVGSPGTQAPPCAARPRRHVRPAPGHRPGPDRLSALAAACTERRPAHPCRVLAHLAAALDLRRRHHRPPARSPRGASGRPAATFAHPTRGSPPRGRSRPPGSSSCWPDPSPTVPCSCRPTSGSRSPSRSRSWHSLHRNAPRPPVPVAPPTAHRR